MSQRCIIGRLCSEASLWYYTEKEDSFNKEQNNGQRVTGDPRSQAQKDPATMTDSKQSRILDAFQNPRPLPLTI
jgi:hypothetical protein